MKKIIFVFCAVMAVGVGTYAQQKKGFYIKPVASYFTKVTPVEFPNVGSLQPRETVLSLNPTTGKTTQVSDRTITGSFGQGTRFGLTLGYQFNDVVGFEFTGNYYNSTEQLMAQQTVNVGSAPYLTLKSVGKVVAYDIAPTLVLNIPTDSKIKPYARIGVILPVGGYLEITTDVNDKTGAIAATLNPAFKAVSLTRTERVKANPTIGFTSGLGLNFQITKNIALATELEYRNISISSKSKELTVFNATGTLANGTAVPVGLSNLPYSTVNTTYVKELTQTSNVAGNTGFDSTKAGNDLTSYINIGGLGFSVGLKIGF